MIPPLITEEYVRREIIIEGPQAQSDVYKRQVQIISDTALEQRHVLGIDEIHTRLFGDRVYVDLEIRVDGSLPLRDAHAAAEAVHNAVENRYPQVKHCMVHVNPGEPED